MMIHYPVHSATAAPASRPNAPHADMFTITLRHDGIELMMLPQVASTVTKLKSLLRNIKDVPKILMKMQR